MEFLDDTVAWKKKGVLLKGANHGCAHDKANQGVYSRGELPVNHMNINILHFLLPVQIIDTGF